MSDQPEAKPAGEEKTGQEKLPYEKPEIKKYPPLPVITGTSSGGTSYYYYYY
jgi:hypothetical protein